MGSLENKTVIVIGGTSGLGESVAKRLVGKVKKLIVTGTNQDALARMSKHIDTAGYTETLDLADEQSITAFAHIIAENNEQDLVVLANAGIWLEGETAATELEKIREVVSIDLIGHMQLTVAVLPIMQAQRQGHIIFVNSVAGLDYTPGNSFYSAAKFGLLGFAKTLQSEVINDNIKVTSFHPGGMNTDLFNRAGHEYGEADWMMDKENIAEILMTIMAQPENVLIDQMSIRTFPQNIVRYKEIG